MICLIFRGNPSGATTGGLAWKPLADLPQAREGPTSLTIVPQSSNIVLPLPWPAWADMKGVVWLGWACLGMCGRSWASWACLGLVGLGGWEKTVRQTEN